MKAEVIIHNRIRCKKCGDIIESFSRHDFKYCSCGNCAVDGGHDYLRRCYKTDEWEDMSECKEIEINPKYKVGDIVLFTYPLDMFVLKGKIVSVDIYPNSVEINYDILTLDADHLYKHIEEKYIAALL